MPDLLGLSYHLADSSMLLKVLHEADSVVLGEVSGPSTPIVRELLSHVKWNQCDVWRIE
jgi:hypothetical protein